MAASIMSKGLLSVKSLNVIVNRSFHPSSQCLKSLPKKIRLSHGIPSESLTRHRRSAYFKDRVEEEKHDHVAPRDYKYVYPEFLPDPDWQKRDKIREIIERKDMVKRRQAITIPEFYVGSLVSVIVSDPHSPQKSNRFVGICIDRQGHGLRAWMLLRNVLDGQGVEIMYELYNPLIQKIEVLKLEKRLDEKLYYLRDAAPEYSTVPFDMERIIHPPGAPVPVNTLKVKLNPRPWHERWERQNLNGIQPLELPEKFWKRAQHEQIAKPFEKYDLMKQYRETINEDEAEEIYSEVYSQIQKEKAKEVKKGRRKAEKL